MFDISKIYRAKNIADAISALQNDPDAHIISGGSDVLIKIREGKMAGCSLVSINEIGELKGIAMDENENIVIKAATCFTDITNHPVIQKHIPILGNAVDQVGGPQIRNMGTIGGNISNGVTSADSATSLFVLNAKLKLRGANGERTIPIQQYYISAGKVDLKPTELLTDIIIEKKNYQGFFGHYIKYAMRNAMDIATLGCAAYCKLNPDKTRLQELRLAFGVAGPIPMRCGKAEQFASGRPISAGLLKQTAEHALSEVNPRTSWRASKEFRLQLASELTKRAMAQAIVYAGGKVE